MTAAQDEDPPRPMLDAVDLYRFYRSAEEEVVALRGVSLRVVAGEMVVVIGPSGSGKSTLLACVAGLDDPDGGLVRVAGTPISHVSDRIRARVRARLVGVLGQSGNLFDHLTVFDNVVLAARLAHRPQASARAAGAVADVGLEDRRRACPAELSGGESVRAALAVAMVNDAPLIVADEPTGELDEEGEARIVRMLVTHAESGRAVLVASHSPVVAARAHRVVQLRDGSIA